MIIEPSWKASAALVGDAADGPGGTISFKQIAPLSPVLVNINATGLAVGKHAIHIHAFGDVSKGCASTGYHLKHILVSKPWRNYVIPNDFANEIIEIFAHFI